MRILFYTVAGKRSRDIESQALEFREKGHEVMLLTQTPRAPLHDFFDAHGFKSDTFTRQADFFPTWLWVHTRFLLSYVKRNKIDIVYSHLDPCNMVAVFADRFTSTTFVLCRHHAEALEFEGTSRGRWVSKMIYKMARITVVVSANAKRYMADVEHIDPNKIWVIPIAYRFELYDKPAPQQVEKIRNKYPGELHLLTIGRLTALKRIDLIIRVVANLMTHGVKATLTILGQGPEEKKLQALAAELDVADRIHFEGFQHDVLPYLSASDIYIHLSQTESSCTTVKEAGVVSKPVIVCRGVGDFEEYITNEVEGFIVDKHNALKETVDVVLENYRSKEKLKKIGDALHRRVLQHFDIRQVSERYDELHRRVIIKKNQR